MKYSLFMAILIILVMALVAHYRLVALETELTKLRGTAEAAYLIAINESHVTPYQDFDQDKLYFGPVLSGVSNALGPATRTPPTGTCRMELLSAERNKNN